MSLCKMLLVTLIVPICLVMQGCQQKERDSQLISPSQAEAIAKEAYIWAYPMVENYQSIYSLAIDPKSPNFKGPVNQINNVARLFKPSDTAIITPNSDTPYSYLIMDLRAEPLVISMPSIDENRYYSLQLVDLYTHNVDFLGTRQDGNDGGSFLIAGPDWQGATPAGIKRTVHMETQLAFSQFRTQLFGPDDLDNVKQIQAGYEVQPLSVFLGKEPLSAPPIDFPPITRETLDKNFFKYLNFLLQFCPTHSSEKALIGRLMEIGVQAGVAFPPKGTSQELLNAMRKGQESAITEIDETGAKKTSSAGMFGNRKELDNDYLKRAISARFGIYGLSDAEALYPVYLMDTDGNPLNGADEKYTLRFPKGQFPPAKAFWSVTMYDGKTRLLVENPLNRYLINSLDLKTLKKDDDGGTTLYLQHQSPGKDKEPNWLPAPNGPMFVVMRIYLPESSVLEGKWQAPVMQSSNKQTPKNSGLTVKEAFEYSSPSLQTHATLIVTTKTKGLKTNGYLHYRELTDHTFKEVVSPNNDTIYSGLLVDLRQSPQIVTIPDTGERYLSVMMTDLRAYNFDVLVQQPGKYLFALKGYKGKVPTDVTLYEVESDFLLFAIRTGVSGPEDLPNVIAIQDQMKVEPLNPVADNHLPLNAPALDAHWVTRMQWVIEHSPALDPADKEIADFIRNLQPTPENAEIGKKTMAGLLKYGNTLTSTMGMYGKRSQITVDHRTRAASNRYQHLALENERAAYPKISTDADGKPLIGSKQYTFSMPKDKPINDLGFWSLTVYETATKQFVPNDAKLYRILDETSVANGDGSVTIVLGGERGDAKNWLPLPKDGSEWYALLRLYEGKEDVVKGTWPVPKMEVTK